MKTTIGSDLVDLSHRLLRYPPWPKVVQTLLSVHTYHADLSS